MADEIDTTVVIDDTSLNRVKTKLGYPILDEVILEDADIKEYCIKPALEEYFRWFPKQATYTSTVNGTFEIAFPDDYTFGILDARLANSLSNITGSLTGNRIADIIVGNQYNKYIGYGGTYGTRFNFNGMDRAREMDLQLRNAKLSRRENARVIARIEDRKVKGFAGSSAQLTIIWAKFSYSFSDIKFERKEEVIELCQSYLLDFFANTPGLIKNQNLSIEIDSTGIQRTAKEMKDNILKKWESFVKVRVVPKGTGVTSF